LKSEVAREHATDSVAMVPALGEEEGLTTVAANVVLLAWVPHESPLRVLVWYGLALFVVPEHATG